MFTSLWPISALYLAWIIFDWDTPEKGESTTSHLLLLSSPPSSSQWEEGCPPVLLPARVAAISCCPSLVCRWPEAALPAAMGCLEALSGLFPCEGRMQGARMVSVVVVPPKGPHPHPAIVSPQLVKTHDLSPSHNYIIGSHPHGILCVGAFCNFITGSTGFGEMFPGIRSFLATLAGNFRLPIFREYLMSGGEWPRAAAATMASARGVPWGRSPCQAPTHLCLLPQRAVPTGEGAPGGPWTHLWETWSWWTLLPSSRQGRGGALPVPCLNSTLTLPAPCPHPAYAFPAPCLQACQLLSGALLQQGAPLHCPLRGPTMIHHGPTSGTLVGTRVLQGQAAPSTGGRFHRRPVPGDPPCHRVPAVQEWHRQRGGHRHRRRGRVALLPSWRHHPHPEEPQGLRPPGPAARVGHG